MAKTDKQLINCPIEKSAKEITEAGEAMLKGIRRLRVELANCSKCTQLDNCTVRQNLNTTINQVITELNDEWGLVGSYD